MLRSAAGREMTAEKTSAGFGPLWRSLEALGKTDAPSLPAQLSCPFLLLLHGSFKPSWRNRWTKSKWHPSQHWNNDPKRMRLHVRELVLWLYFNNTLTWPLDGLPFQSSQEDVGSVFHSTAQCSLRFREGESTEREIKALLSLLKWKCRARSCGQLYLPQKSRPAFFRHQHFHSS